MANTKDLKATGVARAAARLLEQDVAEGGLAILSVRRELPDIYVTHVSIVWHVHAIMSVCTYAFT